MDKIKEIIITAFITSIIGGVTYLVKDYIELKEVEIIRKEKKILDSAYKKIDSLYRIEVQLRKDYKVYINHLFDSLATVSNDNITLTNEAITLITKENEQATTAQSDSIYNVLNRFRLGTGTNNISK
jgi:hypothetical protein|tara:strand:+ start:122 stop:502 length:381 start_codon:yes stop_codon:yes gene_type:complete